VRQFERPHASDHVATVSAISFASIPFSNAELRGASGPAPGSITSALARHASPRSRCDAHPRAAPTQHLHRPRSLKRHAANRPSP
jgi:hypothetical protein